MSRRNTTHQLQFQNPVTRDPVKDLTIEKKKQQQELGIWKLFCLLNELRTRCVGNLNLALKETVKQVNAPRISEFEGRQGDQKILAFRDGFAFLVVGAVFCLYLLDFALLFDFDGGKFAAVAASPEEPIFDADLSEKSEMERWRKASCSSKLSKNVHGCAVEEKVLHELHDTKRVEVGKTQGAAHCSRCLSLQVEGDLRDHSFLYQDGCFPEEVLMKYSADIGVGGYRNELIHSEDGENGIIYLYFFLFFHDFFHDDLSENCTGDLLRTGSRIVVVIEVGYIFEHVECDEDSQHIDADLMVVLTVSTLDEELGEVQSGSAGQD